MFSSLVAYLLRCGITRALAVREEAPNALTPCGILRSCTKLRCSKVAADFLCASLFTGLRRDILGRWAPSSHPCGRCEAVPEPHAFPRHAFKPISLLVATRLIPLRCQKISPHPYVRAM